MGDAPRELANRLHLHGLPKLQLDRLALGDVVGKPEEVLRNSLLVENRDFCRAQEPHALLSGGDGFLQRDFRNAGLEDGVVTRHEMICLILREEVVVVFADELVAPVAEQIEARLVEQEKAVILGVLDEQQAGYVFDDGFAEKVGALQFFLCLLANGIFRLQFFRFAGQPAFELLVVLDLACQRLVGFSQLPDRFELVSCSFVPDIGALSLLHQFRKVFDPVNDPSHRPVLVEDRRVQRRPVSLFKSGFGSGAGDVVLLNAQRIGSSVLNHSLQRGLQVPRASRTGIFRVLGKNFEEFPADDILAIRACRSEERVVGGRDREIGSQNEIRVRSGVEERFEIEMRSRRRAVHHATTDPW